MEFEGICGVAMSDMGSEIGGNIQNLDRFERASVVECQPLAAPLFSDLLLHTDTATNTKLLRDECFLICRIDLDAQLPHLHHRT